MRKRERQTVFAGFRQNRSEGVCGKILELVNEQIKIAAVGFWPVCPLRHRAKLKLRHQKGNQANSPCHVQAGLWTDWR